MTTEELLDAFSEDIKVVKLMVDAYELRFSYLQEKLNTSIENIF